MLFQNRQFRENLKFGVEMCHEGIYIIFLNYVL